MNQSAKQPVGTSKFTRPAHERFTDTKTTLKHEVWNDSYFAPRGGGLQMDRNDQTTGMIKDSLGFEIFNFGIFWGRKILASIFLGSLI